MRSLRYSAADLDRLATCLRAQAADKTSAALTAAVSAGSRGDPTGPRSADRLLQEANQLSCAADVLSGMSGQMTGGAS